MREFWGLWNRGALRDHLVGLGLLHPDEMSELVLVTWWRHLHDRPLRVDEEVARLQGLRRGAWRPDPRCVCHSYGACGRQQYIRSHDGVVRGFAIYDCCCGLKPQVTEGVVHTAGFDEPMVVPYWPAFREGNALCREASFAGVSARERRPLELPQVMLIPPDDPSLRKDSAYAGWPSRSPAQWRGPSTGAPTDMRRGSSRSHVSDRHAHSSGPKRKRPSQAREAQTCTTNKARPIGRVTLLPKRPRRPRPKPKKTSTPTRVCPT